MRGIAEADLERLAAALAALLASCWRAHHAADEEGAEDQSAAEEVRGAGARSSP